MIGALEVYTDRRLLSPIFVIAFQRALSGPGRVLTTESTAFDTGYRALGFSINS